MGIDLQGQNANKSGRGLEDQVEELISKKGIKVVQYRDVKGIDFGKLIKSEPKGCLVKNLPYVNMYGKNARGEFTLFTPNIGDWRIECRKQLVSGSVEDKLPKLFNDCLCMEENNVIIVLEGNGFSDEARDWLKKKASSVKYKNVRVMSLFEFTGWLDYHFGHKSKSHAISRTILASRFLKNRSSKKHYNA
jgi:hypothetical protein